MKTLFNIFLRTAYLLILISIFLATLVNLSLEFGTWLVTKAPLHEIYGWSFKTPVISQFVILSLCFLLGFSLVEIFTRIERSKLENANLKKGISMMITFTLLISILIPK